MATRLTALETKPGESLRPLHAKGYRRIFVRMNARGAAVAGLLLALVTGCSSVQSSAVHTGPLRLPPRAGPVAIFTARSPAAGGWPSALDSAVELGVVEVHASGVEGAIDELMPEFVEKVAQLGGDAAVIDALRARFDIVSRPFAESYTYPCGVYVCTGTQMYSTNDEIMIVTLRGRAFRMRRAP